MPHYKDHDLTSVDHPDVDISGPQEGDVITWDSASQRWIAGPGGGGGGVGSPGLDGQPGPPGPAGSFAWQGVWDVGTNYSTADVVRHADALYIAITNNVGEEPTLP
jgi:hypothetical protein